MLPADTISGKILTIRGKKVILASDLAEVYGVATKALNQAVKRNAAKFPADFAFQLAREEAKAASRLRSQFVTLKEMATFQILTVCFHRARGHYGRNRSEQSRSHPDECLCGESVHQNARSPDQSIRA